MTKELRVADVLNAYLDAIDNWGKSLFVRSAKQSNRRYFKMIDLSLDLRDLGEPGWEALESLLTHEKPLVRLCAALDTYLRNPQRTMAVLESLVRSEKFGIVKGDAASCLRQMHYGEYKDPTQWDRYKSRYAPMENT